VTKFNLSGLFGTTQIFLLLLMLLLFFNSSPLADGVRPWRQMIVWNVGQGAWSTEIDDQICLHFDAGGERSALPMLSKYCEGHENVLFLSHADQDHIGFAASLAQTFPTCVESLPVMLSPRKKRNLSPIPLCSTPQDLSTLDPSLASTANKAWPLKIFDGTNPRAKRMMPNDTSRVWISRNEWFVIPGDSPKREEKIWRQKIPHPSRIRILILGHHGSRTSTSDKTLLKMSHLEMAVSSARQVRFGHPHAEVIALLKKHHIALIRTEYWGHLHFLEE
jgi:competence protein ComEC